MWEYRIDFSSLQPSANCAGLKNEVSSNWRLLRVIGLIIHSSVTAPNKTKGGAFCAPFVIILIIHAPPSQRGHVGVSCRMPEHIPVMCERTLTPCTCTVYTSACLSRKIQVPLQMFSKDFHAPAQDPGKKNSGRKLWKIRSLWVCLSKCCLCKFCLIAKS